MNATQRAVVHDTTGGPEVLRLATDVPVLSPGYGEVLVEVHAVGLNPFDAKARAGKVPLDTPFPRGVGSDFAGVVVEVGPGAAYVDGRAARVGDAVLGSVPGALRDLLAASAAGLALRPAGLDVELAASIPTAARTAALSLAASPVRAGETVLVTGAAGSVGFVYAQLALRAGARVVGTASPQNHARLHAIGVEPVAYGDGLLDRVRTLAPGGVDAVQDNVGGDNVDLALKLGVPPQRICEIVDHAATARWGLAAPARERSAELLADLAARFSTGELTLPIGAVYGPQQIRDAFAALERRHRMPGKVVVRWRPPAES